LIAQAKEAGYNPKLLKTIWEEYSRKDDWDERFKFIAQNP
jgi:hypothetical protein